MAGSSSHGWSLEAISAIVLHYAHNMPELPGFPEINEESKLFCELEKISPDNVSSRLNSGNGDYTRSWCNRSEKDAAGLT